MPLLKSSFSHVLFALLLCVSTRAADTPNSPQPDTSAQLSIERIYSSGDFNSKGYSGRWKKDSSGYYRTIPSAETKGGRDIVLIDPETGTTNVVVAAEDLIPLRELLRR